MRVLRTKAEARLWVRQRTAARQTVGLVPTMGALHEGHLSLVRRSRTVCQHTAVTIFVNPTQFGPAEDLDRYPRTLDEDLSRLREDAVDLVFVPDPAEIYPPGFSTYIDPPAVAAAWEGRLRPGHFRGVATVVLKLFQILPATHAFFGQKDYQQAAVIAAMVRDLDVPMELETCPTLRDEDGLAMSSRNRYLSAAERQRALGIPAALAAAAGEAARGERSASVLENRMRERMQHWGVDEIDYAAIADAVTLEPLEQLDRPAVALIAARVGATRLIDSQRLENSPRRRSRFPQ